MYCKIQCLKLFQYFLNKITVLFKIWTTWITIKTYGKNYVCNSRSALIKIYQYIFREMFTHNLWFVGILFLMCPYAGGKGHYVHFFQYWNNAINLMYFHYTAQRYRVLNPISINNRKIFKGKWHYFPQTYFNIF